MRTRPCVTTPRPRTRTIQSETVKEIGRENGRIEGRQKHIVHLTVATLEQYGREGVKGGRECKGKEGGREGG
jgi:hypothetical protein